MKAAVNILPVNSRKYLGFRGYRFWFSGFIEIEFSGGIEIECPQHFLRICEESWKQFWKNLYKSTGEIDQQKIIRKILRQAPYDIWLDWKTSKKQVWQQHKETTAQIWETFFVN